MAKGNRGWNLKGPEKVVLRGPEHPRWKGDAASPDSKRARAQRLYSLGVCQECGAPATDRHHRDGDTGNNARENLAILCRHCHMAADGRLERFAANSVSSRGPQPPKPCANCGRPSKPLRRGRCHPCHEYLTRRGRERPYVDDGRREKAEPALAVPCTRCGRPAGCKGPPVKGMCTSCYTVTWRQAKRARTV